MKRSAAIGQQSRPLNVTWPAGWRTNYKKSKNVKARVFGGNIQSCHRQGDRPHVSQLGHLSFGKGAAIWS